MEKLARHSEARFRAFKKRPGQAVFDVFVLGMGCESNYQYNSVWRSTRVRKPHILIFEENLTRTVEGRDGYRDFRFFGWDLGWSARPLRFGAQLVGNRKIVRIEEPSKGPARYRIITNRGDSIWANKLAMEPLLEWKGYWTSGQQSTRVMKAFLKKKQGRRLGK
jgi:hypothetical protein